MTIPFFFGGGGDLTKDYRIWTVSLSQEENQFYFEYVFKAAICLLTHKSNKTQQKTFTKPLENVYKQCLLFNLHMRIS